MSGHRSSHRLPAAHRSVDRVQGVGLELCARAALRWSAAIAPSCQASTGSRARRAAARGPPQRRGGLAHMQHCGGNWRAAAGQVQPVRRCPPLKGVPQRAASAALYGREAPVPCHCAASLPIMSEAEGAHRAGTAPTRRVAAPPLMRLCIQRPREQLRLTWPQPTVRGPPQQRQETATVNASEAKCVAIPLRHRELPVLLRIPSRARHA